MSSDNRTGLFGNGEAIPLQGVRVEAEVRLGAARTRVLQRYRNVESKPVEAVYVFPLPEGSAVCGFEARIGDRHIQGTVQEREKAFERYDDAMMDGNGAFLLDQERPDVFTASVGNLEAGAEVVLAISFVSQLHREGDAIRYALPTTISPRYVPEHVVDAPTVGQPDWERVTPPVALEVPYGIEVSVDARLGTAIRSVASPSHPVEVEVDGEKARVRFASREQTMDRDFVLLLRSEAAGQPSALLQREEDGATTAVVTFLPTLEETAPADSETIFLVDCSGSMGGTSMEEARRALRLCLRSLSPGSAFNVIRFGSRFEQLFPVSRAYDDASMEEADRHAQAMHANLGGTEILRPLQAIVAQEGRAQRQVILLTDGQVANEPEVVALAREHRDSVRIFTFGIGAGASEYLVRGVARASRGAAEFIHPGERIEPKVLRQFNRIASPPLTGVCVECPGVEASMAPRDVPPVFDGDALTLFIRFQGEIPEGAVLRGDSLGGPLRAEVSFDADIEEGNLASTLWAQARLRELEDGSAGGGSRRGSNQRGRKDQRRGDPILTLALRHGLVSSRTSFVAVEVRDEADRTQQQAELRRIPVALTSGWGDIKRRQVRSRQRPRMASPLAATLSAGLRTLSARQAPRSAPADIRAFSALRMSRASAPASGIDDLLGAVADKLGEACEEACAPGGGMDHLDLLMLQRADGSFTAGPGLIEYTGLSPDDLTDIASDLGVDEAVVATVAALMVLHRDASGRRDEWRRAATKADRWLENRGAPRAAIERALEDAGI